MYYLKVAIRILIFFKDKFKRQCQQKPPELESGGSADRLETKFFEFPIQK
jgi:hypothetical protein